MSKYLLLIYDNEEAWVNADAAESAKLMEGHMAFQAKYGAAVLGGDGLQPVATATTVHAGGTSVTDGPFAETKEALGGYYLVEADDLDVAIGMAKDIPVYSGGIEVRPVMVFD